MNVVDARGLALGISFTFHTVCVALVGKRGELRLVVHWRGLDNRDASGDRLQAWHLREGDWRARCVGDVGRGQLGRLDGCSWDYGWSELSNSGRDRRLLGIASNQRIHIADDSSWLRRWDCSTGH